MLREAAQCVVVRAQEWPCDIIDGCLDFDEIKMAEYEGDDHQVPNTHKIHSLFERSFLQIETERGEATSGL
jgi:hypothetical protein